jgi:Fe-S-cluster containining protein
MSNQTVNFGTFRQLVSRNKRRLRLFLSRLEKKTPKNLHLITLEVNELAWPGTDCLHCANCCKTMSPTYTQKDIARISAYLGTSQRAFREKWLYKDRSGDWINKKAPCQFLDLKTNHCQIYDVRPGDCAGFPHHGTKKIVEYGNVFKQNIAYCPATYRLVTQMQEGFAEGKWELKK